MAACVPHRATQPHEFHAASGWCIHGCGVRDDGAHYEMRRGVWIRTGADLTPEQIEFYARRAEQVTAPPG